MFANLLEVSIAHWVLSFSCILIQFTFLITGLMQVAFKFYIKKVNIGIEQKSS